MDAVKYFKTKNRMTKGCIHGDYCSQCVLSVAAVEKWAEEHLVKTRMSDFLEKFPKAEVLKYGYDEYIDICPISIDTTRTCPNGECKNCKLEYWNEEVEDNERD